mmetsp:Transcript_69090/g.178097  ORF Transcript_69090/g.178097 Transcript_69090/m.178097 type:complete len:116 (+) Transcript_69090:178-525(+)
MGGYPHAIDAAEGPEWAKTTTTVMIRNIACRFSQDDFIDVLHKLGLAGHYDGVCVPKSRKGKSNLGYGFVNFLTPESARLCYSLCHGRVFGESQTMKLCEIIPAKVQGSIAHIHL